MKVKTKMGFHTGKVINYKVSVDDNALTGIVVAAVCVVATKAVEQVGTSLINAVDGMIDGMNERKELKLRHKLNNPTK